MTGECRKRLLEGLLVANIGKDLVEDGESRAGKRGDLQTKLVHERSQTDGLECHRLPTRVRAGNNEMARVIFQHHINRHDTGTDERVTNLGQPNRAHGELRSNTVRRLAVARPRVYTVEIRDDLVRPGQGEPVLPRLGAQTFENAEDLLPVAVLSAPEVVVRLDQYRRLNEDGLTRLRVLVDDAVDPALVPRLERQHDPALSHHRVVYVPVVLGSFLHEISRDTLNLALRRPNGATEAF